MKRPNIVVITLEHTSFRSLGCYGNEDVRTPSIDSFARESLVFETCVVPCPLCVPSRAAFFSGRYPSVTTSRQNGVLLNPAELNLPTLLAEDGYRCGLFGKNHCFVDSKKTGFIEDRPEQPLRRAIARGHGGPFAKPPKPIDPDLIAARQSTFTWSEYPRPIWGCGPYPAEPEEAATWGNVEGAIEFLAQAGGQPSFVWLSFQDPHPPYRCPSPYDQMYDPASLQLPPLPQDGTASFSEVLQFFYREGCFELFDEEQRRQTMAYFYGSLSYVDWCVGQFVQELDRLGLSENTGIVLTGDHGDFMGERGLVRKCAAFYDCLVRVPLIVRGLPGIRAGRSELLASSIDVMPTLLEVAGIAKPDGVQGRSLLSTLEGRLPQREALYGELGGFVTSPPERGEGLEKFTFGLGQSRMLRTNRYKYVYHASDSDELYDLENDPWELVNIAAEPGNAELLADLRLRLLRECVEAEDPLDWRRFS